MDGVVKSNAFLDRVSLSPGTGQLDQYFSLLQKNGSALGRRINLRLRRQYGRVEEMRGRSPNRED